MFLIGANAFKPMLRNTVQRLLKITTKTIGDTIQISYENCKPWIVDRYNKASSNVWRGRP